MAIIDFKQSVASSSFPVTNILKLMIFSLRQLYPYLKKKPLKLFAMVIYRLSGTVRSIDQYIDTSCFCAKSPIALFSILLCSCGKFTSVMNIYCMGLHKVKEIFLDQQSPSTQVHGSQSTGNIFFRRRRMAFSKVMPSFTMVSSNHSTSPTGTAGWHSKGIPAKL